MNPKLLWKVSIVTAPEAGDAVAELLQRHFNQPASSWTDLESGRTSTAMYLLTKPPWPALRENLRTELRRIERCGLRVAPATVSCSRMQAKDWAESWKRHFQPLEISSALLIKPSWSRRRAKPGQAVVILDPGLSFGTGRHPTTAFCLRQIAVRGKMRQGFLDVGTGSGILAIAAAKLGYAPVDAFDSDPQAVAIARQNARRNRVLDRLRIHQADLARMKGRAARRYDLICANLISDLLLDQRDRLISSLKPGGILVTAGILKSEFPRIRRAYEKGGLRLIAARSEKEWRSGAFAFSKRN